MLFVDPIAFHSMAKVTNVTNIIEIIKVLLFLEPTPILVGL